MRIEEGKYYRTRDGRKVGPAIRNDNGEVWEVWSVGDGTYYDNGTWSVYDPNCEHDLIAEWQEGPSSPSRARRLCRSNTAELRAAAATLIEIADALEDAGE